MLVIIGVAEWSPFTSAAGVPVIYVANAGNPSTITAVNGVTDSVERSIPIHHGVAIDVGVAPNGKHAYALVVGNETVGLPGLLIPISTATNAVGKAISVGVDPQTVVFNPNGRFAYVIDGFNAATTALNAPGTVTPVDLVNRVAGPPIKVGTNPSGMAITPNGDTAYVTNSNAMNGHPTTITVINLVTDRPEKTIDVAADTIAVTLNGEVAFALGPDAVIPIAVATNRAERPIDLGGVPQAIALAPDGQIAWVLATPDLRFGSKSTSVTLTAIDTGTYRIGKVIRLAGMPQTGQFFVAITANGAHIFVLGQGSGKRASILAEIAASNDVAGSPMRLGPDATALAVSPNSAFAYVLNPGDDYQGPPITPHPPNSPGTIIPISTATGKLGKLIRVGLLATAMAITK